MGLLDCTCHKCGRTGPETMLKALTDGANCDDGEPHKFTWKKPDNAKQEEKQ